MIIKPIPKCLFYIAKIIYNRLRNSLQFVCSVIFSCNDVHVALSDLEKLKEKYHIYDE